MSGKGFAHYKNMTSNHVCRAGNRSIQVRSQNPLKWMKDSNMAMRNNVVDDAVPDGEDEATVTQTAHEVLAGL